MPVHPIQLFIAFTLATFAFLGIGLIISMVASSTSAVQAWGQAIFLPMLIIGGVAIPLRMLPKWGPHLAAFLPGRYAVHAMDAAVRRAGISHEQIDAVRRAFRILYREGHVIPEALARIEAELGAVDVIAELVTFIRQSSRGINVMRAYQDVRRQAGARAPARVRARRGADGRGRGRPSFDTGSGRAPDPSGATRVVMRPARA